MEEEFVDKLYKAKMATSKRFWYYASLNPWYYPQAANQAYAENLRMKILNSMDNTVRILELLSDKEDKCEKK